MTAPYPPPVGSKCWIELEAVIFPGRKADVFSIYGNLVDSTHPVPPVGGPSAESEGEGVYDMSTGAVYVTRGGIWYEVDPDPGSTFIDIDTGVVFDLNPVTP